MVKIVKTEGIILKKQSLLQKDILLTCFTQTTGKIATIAKGVKKITSRRAPHVQTGNLVNLQLTKKHDTYYLDQSTLVSGFSAIKDDQHKTSFLYIYFFILDRLLPNEQAEEVVYHEAKSFLVAMARKADFNITDFTEYLNRLLSRLGYISNARTFPELIRFVEDSINEKVPTTLL